MSALRCKLSDCAHPRKDWKTPTRLGAHQWRAHGVKGKARKVGRPPGRPGRPRGPWKNRFKMLDNPVPEVAETAVAEEVRNGDELSKVGNGKQIVAAIMKKAALFHEEAEDLQKRSDEARDKGRELEVLAEKVREIVQK